MTYQVLARKWRPRNFREMAGQGHVLKTLINSLDNDRLHHAYLFTGTRGVGKTTIARILARCLNCESGVTSEPCGQCSACREIDEGRFIDLIEVDAASRTKVEDTRELLDNVQYSPTRGRYKVYLIDEVHMLSGHSFNALLKTLEEPPPHVKFLLATTDPQKLPITVLSRCLQFNLKNISPERLVEHIKHILDEEKIAYEEPALWQLGRAAQGSVRDCLTLLDQAIGYCEGNITDTEVRAFLGTIDQGVIHELVDALVAQDGAGLLQIIETTADHAPDFAAVLADLQSYLHRTAIAQVVPEGIDNSQGDREYVLAHAGKIPAETLQLYYQVALKSRQDLPYAIDARSGLEMALLRMLAFTPQGVPVAPVHSLAQAAPGGEKKKPTVNKPALTPTSMPVTVQPRSLEQKAGNLPPSPSLSDNPQISSTTAPGQDLGSQQDQGEPSGSATAEDKPVPRKPVESAGQDSLATKTASPVIEKTGNLDTSSILLEALTPAKWISLFYQLELEGITRSIAANCLLQSVENSRLVMVLNEKQAAVFNEEHQRRITSQLKKYFGQDIVLEITSGAIDTERDGETPAAWRERMDLERQHEAERIFENDETVKAILETFSGSIQLDSIEPTSPKQY
jgi:DNA polymerase-3 subunit gamma/tau